MFATQMDMLFPPLSPPSLFEQKGDSAWKLISPSKARAGEEGKAAVLEAARFDRDRCGGQWVMNGVTATGVGVSG